MQMNILNNGLSSIYIIVIIQPVFMSDTAFLWALSVVMRCVCRSYGVVLWEMATLGAHPYQGLANEQIFAFVAGGSTMQAPLGCPQLL